MKFLLWLNVRGLTLHNSQTKRGKNLTPNMQSNRSMRQIFPSQRFLNQTTSCPHACYIFFFFFFLVLFSRYVIVNGAHICWPNEREKISTRKATQEFTNTHLLFGDTEGYDVGVKDNPLETS